jgi:hypothetical protein
LKVKILLFVVFYIFWVIAALFVVFGLMLAGQEPGVIPLPAIIVYGVVIMIPVLLFNRSMGEPGWVKTVRADGKAASATVLSVSYSGVRLNRRYIYKVKLRVEPRDDEAFEVSMDDTWFGHPSEGSKIQVKYDPKHKQHVVILSSSPANWGVNRAGLDPELQALYNLETSAAKTNISDELANLARMHKNGDLSDAEFERAKQKLLG